MTAPETTVHPLPPLLRLPDELLAKVALLVVADDRKSVTKLTAICRCLRVVYIGTPELWTYIDSRWPSQVYQLFSHRAGSRPLVLVVGSFAINEMLAQCLHQASEVRLEIASASNQGSQARLQPNAMDCLRDQDLNGLRSLTIDFPHSTALVPAILTHFITPTSCANLAVLKLLGTHVSGLPHLPALRHLVVMSTSMSFGHFHGFLASTPSIERINMKWVMFSFETTPNPEDMPRVHLPALQDLSIVESYQGAALLLGVLSTPQSTLHIRITGSKKDSLTRSYRNTIMECLARFRLARGGDACTTPTVKVTRSGKNHFRAIWTEVIFDGPSLFYSRPVNSAEPEDAFWADVTTVYLEYTLKRPGLDLVAPDVDIDLRMLRRADALVVVGAGFDPEADEVAMRSLENWLVSRHADGTPFHSVKFCQCGGAARVLLERLKAGGVAGAVVWVP
jgi:hypothetical protein